MIHSEFLFRILVKVGGETEFKSKKPDVLNFLSLIKNSLGEGGSRLGAEFLNFLRGNYLLFVGELLRRVH